MLRCYIRVWQSPNRFEQRLGYRFIRDALHIARVGKVDRRANPDVDPSSPQAKSASFQTATGHWNNVHPLADGQNSSASPWPNGLSCWDSAFRVDQYKIPLRQRFSPARRIPRGWPLLGIWCSARSIDPRSGFWNSSSTAMNRTLRPSRLIITPSTIGSRWDTWFATSTAAP